WPKWSFSSQRMRQFREAQNRCNAPTVKPMKYYCPLCKSHLTKDHYHHVLKIQQKEEKLQEGELEKLRTQVMSAKQAAVTAKKREREIRLKAKEDAATARREGTEAEKRRSERLLQGSSAKIKKLQDRIKMLERGTTPQVIGLADEGVLVQR